MKAPYHSDVTQQIFRLSAIPLCTKRNGTVMLQSSSLAFRKHPSHLYTKIQLTTLLQFLFSLKYQDVESTLKSLIKITTAQMICPIHAVKSDFSVTVSVVCHTWQWKCGREILEAVQMQIQSFVFAQSSAFVQSVFIVPLCSYGLSWWYFMMLCVQTKFLVHRSSMFVWSFMIIPNFMFVRCFVFILNFVFVGPPCLYDPSWSYQISR
jgi:hypothetical protein